MNPAIIAMPREASSRSSRPFLAPVLGACLVTCLSLACSAATAAAVVNLDTGKSVVLQTGGTGSLTLSLTNAGNQSALINSYTLGLLVVQTGGTGTLTFDAWIAPATNPLLSDGDAEYSPLDQPALFPLNAPVTIAGTEYFEYYPVQAANTNGVDDVLAAAATRNIGALNVASLEGTGTWAIYVVNQEPAVGGLPVSFFQDAAFADFGFGNLPATNGANLLVGTVTVSVVPEPASIGLVGCALVALAIARRVRRGPGPA